MKGFLRYFKKSRLILMAGVVIAWIVGALFEDAVDEMDMRDIAREVFEEERAKRR